MKYLPFVVVLAGLLAPAIITGCRSTSSRMSQMGKPAVSAPVKSVSPGSQPKTAAAAVVVGKDEAACPVLGTVMKKSMMIPVQHNGKTYYVCCSDCVGLFKANPAKYINHPAPLTRDMPH